LRSFIEKEEREQYTKPLLSCPEPVEWALFVFLQETVAFISSTVFPWAK